MTKSWRALIIDDEDLARQRLRRLLQGYDFIQLTGEADNGQAALTLITAQQPDLIFLDIEMPVLNGFEVLQQLQQHPKVIFTTAYDQYALKAFEEESVDYLLKPISPERLDKAMKKLQQLTPRSDFQLPLDLLMKQLQVKKELKTLTVKLGDRIVLVKVSAIAYIEAEDKYVFLAMQDGKRHLTEFTLTGLEEKLPESFARINRGTIINTEQIAEIRKSFNGTLVFVLNDAAQSRLSSSRSFGNALKERFDL